MASPIDKLPTSIDTCCLVDPGELNLDADPNLFNIHTPQDGAGGGCEWAETVADADATSGDPSCGGLEDG